MTLKLKSHRNSHTHLKAAKADTQPKLSKKCACLTQEEFQNIFFLAFKKFKQSKHKPTKQIADTYRNDTWTTEKEAHAHNSTYPKVAVQWLNQALCFYQSLCLADSEMLRDRHPQVTAIRYAQATETLQR